MDWKWEVPIRIGRTIEDRPRLFDFLRSELTSPHIGILGASGAGKSSLISDIAFQLWEKGEGFTIVDPGGDLVEDFGARVARQYIETNDQSKLSRFHWFEPGNYTMLFGHDPAKFDPAKPIHPEHRSNAFLAWKFCAGHQYGELIQLKQGQMDFEQNARLQRITTRSNDGCFQDIGGGKHLPVPFGLWLLDPELPRSQEIFDLVAPHLDNRTLADLTRIRGYRRVEDRMKEIESFMNRTNSILPPQARAIFSRKETIPFRKIIQAGGAMLWHLRPTEYFSHDGKATFGKIAIHAVITTMMSMPREMRCRHTLIIDEASEFCNEFLLWAFGALRKTGLSIIVAGQDLSSFRKKELDMVPKVVSQLNLIVFQMGWYEDVEILTKRMRSGELCFDKYEQETQWSDGHEWIPVEERSFGKQVGIGEADTETEQESETDSKQNGKTRSQSRTRTKTKSKNRSTGDVDTRSRPLEYDRRKEQVSHADSASNGTAEGEGQGEAEQEGVSETEGHSTMKGRSKGKQTSTRVGFSETVSEKRIPLPRIIVKKQKTPMLKTPISDQREKQYQEMIGLDKREAFAHFIGARKAVHFRTLDIPPAFLSAVAQMRALEMIKREVFDLHPYYFVPNFEPAEEERMLREFIDEAENQPEIAERGERNDDDDVYGN